MMERPRILIADDVPSNLLLLQDLLEPDYQVHAANNGKEVVDFLEGGGNADLILMDVMMPVMDGYEACRRIKAEPATRDIPLVFLTSLESATDETVGLDLGAEDFIHKPYSPAVVLARVRNHLALAEARRDLEVHNRELGTLVAERTQEVVRQSEELAHRDRQVIATQQATISALCALAEARDNETGNHILRTQHYVQHLAESLREHPRFRDSLDDEVVHMLYRSAPLHDIGKVAIPDAILCKPGKLTPEEWDVMKRHCQAGRDALAQAVGGMEEQDGSFLRYAMEIAYGHHERWDGTGYPQGLSGEDIPLPARLMAVADVYDALISKRVYKPAFTHDQALEIMAQGRGSHFDPDVVDVLLRNPSRFQVIADGFRD